MKLRREQRTVLVFGAVVVVATLGLLAGMAPALSARGNPVATGIFLVVFELALFGTAAWVAGRGPIRRR